MPTSFSGENPPNSNFNEIDHYTELSQLWEWDALPTLTATQSKVSFNGILITTVFSPP
jgi:hypothetical protein